MSRASRIAGLVTIIAAGSLAGADEETFWEDLARPHGARYGALVARAAALIEAGSPTPAAALLVDATGLEPREPQGFYLLGLARYRLREWQACTDALLTVGRLDPGYQPAHTEDQSAEPVDEMLGLCLSLSGHLDEAVAHYRRMLAGPAPATGLDSLHGNLGDCYHALGRLEEAAQEYQAAIALSPRRAALHAALAVAYDRDERVERARESMGRALAIDSQLVELTSPATYFIPPADLYYYLGLAHQVASDGAPRRALAIASFRKYLEAASAQNPPGPWVRRARQHLTELGAPALRAGDVQILPADAPEVPALTRAMVALGPELAACLPAAGQTVVRASIAYHGHGKDARSGPPTLSLSSAGPDAASPEALDCMSKRLQQQKHAVRQMTRIQVAIGPP